MFGPPVLRLSEGVGALKFYNENPFKGSVSVSALGLTGAVGFRVCRAVVVFRFRRWMGLGG